MAKDDSTEFSRTYRQLVNSTLDSLNKILTGKSNGVGLVNRETLLKVLALSETIRECVANAPIDIVDAHSAAALHMHLARAPGFSEFMRRCGQKDNTAPADRRESGSAGE